MDFTLLYVFATFMRKRSCFRDILCVTKKREDTFTLTEQGFTCFEGMKNETKQPLRTWK